MEAVESNERQSGETSHRGIKKDKRNWWACVFILANNSCQFVAFSGVSTNLVNYMKDRLHQGSRAAANNYTNWKGTTYITPLIAAFLAHAFLGRYWTIALFMLISVLGYTVLTVSVVVREATAAQSAAFYTGLYLVALGSGLQPCLSSSGADQFDESDEAERSRQSSFLNWFYQSLDVGSLIGASWCGCKPTSGGVGGWGYRRCSMGLPSRCSWPARPCTGTSCPAAARSRGSCR